MVFGRLGGCFTSKYVGGIMGPSERECFAAGGASQLQLRPSIFPLILNLGYILLWRGSSGCLYIDVRDSHLCFLLR